MHWAVVVTVMVIRGAGWWWWKQKWMHGIIWSYVAQFGRHMPGGHKSLLCPTPINALVVQSFGKMLRNLIGRYLPSGSNISDLMCISPALDHQTAIFFPLFVGSPSPHTNLFQIIMSLNLFISCLYCSVSCEIFKIHGCQC